MKKKFWVRKSSILANLFKINHNAYGLCACTYENTFRNIKSGRGSLWLFIREKQLSLAQLENWEISNQPEALPKKDNLYLGWFSCLIYPSWGRQISLPVWWACLYVITNFFSTLIIPLLLSLIGFFLPFLIISFIS